MALDYYSYSDADTMVQVFNAVAALTASSDYLDLIKVVLLIGGLVVAAATIANNRFVGLNWFMIAILIYLGLLVPKVDVIINDRSGAQTPATVGNVPIGNAFFAAVTSKIGDYITTATEATFTLPNDLKYSENGMLFGHRMIREMREVRIRDRQLADDFHSFMENCAWYDMNNYSFYSIDDLLSAADPLDANHLGNTNTLLWTTVDGNPRTCDQAILELETALDAHVTAQKPMLAQKLNPAQTPANAIVALEAQLPSAYQQMFSVAKNASDIMRSNMLFNMIKNNDAVAAARAADPASAALALASAQAELTQINTFRTMSNIAEGALPKIRTVIEAIIMASFPFVLPVFIMAGHASGPLLRSYVIALMWIQLWPPLYAVLNLVATANTSKNIYAISRVDADLTTANAFDVYAQTLSDADIAGYMALSVPILAYAIIKGGEMAFVSLASRLMMPGASAAQQAGGAAATGNFSFGQMSMENMRAFQTQLSPSTVGMGLQSFQDGAGNMHTYAQGSGQSYIDQRMNSTRFQGDIRESVSQEAANQSSSFIQSSHSNQERSTAHQAAAFGRALATQDQKENRFTSGEGFSTQESASFKETYKQMETAARKLSEDLAINEKEAFGLLASATVVGNAAPEFFGMGGGIKLAGGGKMEFSADMQKRVSEAVDSLSQQAKDDLRVWDRDYQSDKSFQEQATSSSSDQESVRTSLESGRRHEELADKQLQEGVKLDRISREVMSDQSTISQDVLRSAVATDFLIKAIEAENGGRWTESSDYMRQGAQALVDELKSSYTTPTSNMSRQDVIDNYRNGGIEEGNKVGGERAVQDFNSQSEQTIKKDGFDTSQQGDNHNVKQDVQENQDTVKKDIKTGEIQIEGKKNAQQDLVLDEQGRSDALEHGQRVSPSSGDPNLVIKTGENAMRKAETTTKEVADVIQQHGEKMIDSMEKLKEDKDK